MWAWRLTLPSELPFWELKSRWTPKLSKSDCKGQNTSHWRVLFIIKKLLKCRCLKWASMTHLDICNTSYGKKKGWESKLVVWLLTTKSWESTWLSCMQVACNMPLESSQRELQLCFTIHLDWKSKHEVTASQSCGSSNPGSFGTPLFLSLGSKSHLDVGFLERWKIYYMGEGGGVPRVQVVVSFVNPKSLVACLSTKGAPTLY